MTTNMEAALQLARAGLPVFPLHSALPFRDGKFVCTCGSLQCRNAAKHPLARLAPRGLTDACTDETRVREWWLSAPNANVGMATGKIVVLDVDPQHGGADALRALEERFGELPLTWRAFTGGGGEHIYFRAPHQEIRNSAGRLGPGLDVRGVGGYVVAPPSLHISGRNYEWSVDHHPDDIALAEFPDSLKSDATGQGGKIIAATASEWRDIVSVPTTEGGRNHTLARLAGHLLRRYVDEYVVLELCRIWNATRCSPPLTADEVDRTINSICKRELARRKASL